METTALTLRVEPPNPDENPLPQDLLDAIRPFKERLMAFVEGKEVIAPEIAEAISRKKRERKELIEKYKAATSTEEIEKLAFEIKQCNAILRHLREACQANALWSDHSGDHGKRVSKIAAKKIAFTERWVKQVWEAEELPRYLLDEEMDEDELSDEEREKLIKDWATNRWSYEYRSFGHNEIHHCRGRGYSDVEHLRRSTQPEVLLSNPGPTSFTAVNAFDMYPISRGWGREDEEEKYARGAKLMRKALHKQELMGWTPEDLEIFEACVEKLNKAFLKWRKKRFTAYYKGRYRYDEKNPTKKEIKNFLKETGENDSTRGYRGATPNYYYFKEVILPTIIDMANSVEEMEQIGMDALEVLDEIYRSIYNGTPCPKLANDFLKDYDPTEDDLSRTHISSFSDSVVLSGQFKYFYPRYGLEFVKTVARHNSIRSDIHGGDGFDEILPYGAVIHGYGRIAELVGPEDRDHVFKKLRKKLPWVEVNTISQSSATNQLTPPEDAATERQVLNHLLLEEKDYELKGYSTYLELTGRGMAPELAACIRPEDEEKKWFGSMRWEGVFTGQLFPELKARAIPGIEAPATMKDIQAMIGIMGKVHYLTKAAKRNNYRFFGHNQHSIMRMRSHEALDHVDFSVVDELKAQFEEIEKLSTGLKNIFQSELEELRGAIKRMTSLAFFRRIMGIGLIESGLETNPSSFIQETNPVTQMALSASAFMISIGAMNIPELGIQVDPVRLPMHEVLTSVKLMDPHALQQFMQDRNIERDLRRNVRLVLPELEALVQEDRMTRLGTMAGGAKLHTSKPMDTAIFSEIRNLFGLEQTPFRLIHADDSLILPPLPGNLEPKLLIQALGVLGVINSEYPELQTTMAGREWPQETAGIVGSSVLLATERGVRYQANAFSTSHDHSTDARIMARDAGVMKEGMPFHLDGIQGRTDKLGSRHYGDIDLYRALGTLANHGLVDGPFAKIWINYRKNYLNILKKYGLAKALYKSEWVYDPRGPKSDDSPKKHEAMVAQFTDAWFQSVNRGFGIVDEVEALIENAMWQMEAMRPTIEALMPNDVEKVKHF